MIEKRGKDLKEFEPQIKNIIENLFLPRISRITGIKIKKLNWLNCGLKADWLGNQNKYWLLIRNLFYHEEHEGHEEKIM